MEMTELEFEDNLQRALEQVCPDDPDCGWGIMHIETFEEAGLLTNNRGLVVKLNNGQRFQLKIVEA